MVLLVCMRRGKKVCAGSNFTEDAGGGEEGVDENVCAGVGRALRMVPYVCFPRQESEEDTKRS